MTENLPILYSFRRCPYAMRARLALNYSDITLEHREVILRDKPQHMLETSPKGTVPVLILTNDEVIDESFDIMLWALEQNDNDQWLPNEDAHRKNIFELIECNDSIFKSYLDRYKYPNRYPKETTIGDKARDKALEILGDMDKRIEDNGQLISDKITLADMAIFPFIRQFAHVDRDWFYAKKELKSLQKWLICHIESDLFETIMKKHDIYANTAN